MSDLAITQAGRLDATNKIEQLRQAAAGFESYFVREILKAAEGTGPLAAEREGLFADSKALDQYRGLMYDGIAEQASGGMGIADIIVNQLLAGNCRPRLMK